jgi:hypothetical protein
MNYFFLLTLVNHLNTFNMKTLKQLGLMLLATAFFMACSEDDTLETPEAQLTYTIVYSGNGGVSSSADDEDSESLDVAQPIPAEDSVDGYPNNMPVILFFNDKINLNTIEDNFVVTMDGEQIGGNVSIGEAANGFAILTFIPYEPYTSNSQIDVLLKANLSDDGGNGLAQDYDLSFNISNFNSTPFDNNSSFENGNDGILFLGDGSVMSGTQGCVSATEGSNFSAITSGDALVSTDNAIGGASSICLLGPINSDISSVTFNYNFLSAEFQEFVGSVFDDSFVAVVVGPNGAYAEFITSVNTIGNNNTQCNGFSTLPDIGDSYAGETGWTTHSLNFQNVGSPAYVTFIVTDVSDLIYSSVIALDEVNYN